MESSKTPVRQALDIATEIGSEEPLESTVNAQPNLGDTGVSPRRYLVITELFLPTKGGTAVWFDELYRRLGGKDIHIVTADVPGAADHDRDHPNTVHRVSLTRHAWLRPESLAMYGKLFMRALALSLTNRFEAVHAGRVLPEGLAGLAVARLTGRPLVVYAHGEEITTWRQPSKFHAMCYVYNKADLVVANSEFTAHELYKLGVRHERLKLIHPGVDTSRFRRGLPIGDLRASVLARDDQRLILSVGRLSRRKGFDQVIRALPLLAERGIDAQYAIIGIGDDHARLAALVEECGVRERVHFLGHVTMDDLPRWYNAADVFAMPNREIDGDTEGFGMVFIEAAACGRPSVAGMAGGTGAAVIDGVTGLRVDGSSADRVSAALARILSDGSLAERLGESGWRRATAEFSWEAVARRVAELAPVR
jgi:phosphatidylinositol alpha-1,6-mannosyltransferase